MQYTCPECGYPLGNKENRCPECGSPITYPDEPTRLIGPAVKDSKTDRAQYFYECALIGWKSFCNYFSVSGRASRREYWSFVMLMTIVCCTIPIAIFLYLLPWLGVSIRRMHDAGCSGWWILCPYACVFLLFKKSDEGLNEYGQPWPATYLIN